MYVRIKRRKLTIFLQVEPTDTVLEVKQRLQTLVEQASVGTLSYTCSAICRLHAAHEQYLHPFEQGQEQTL